MLYLRDLGDTEVGGFGISAADDLFLIEDVRLVEQRCTQVTVEFSDESVADFFDEQVDLGRQPERFARCWLHTHPGNSAEPSNTDEDTFARAFGGSSWSLMFILAQGGQKYARLRFGCGPRAELLVPVAIDWDVPFAGADHQAWEREYEECVREVIPEPFSRHRHLSPEEVAFLEEFPDQLDDWDLFSLPHESATLERSNSVESDNE